MTNLSKRHPIVPGAILILLLALPSSAESLRFDLPGLPKDARPLRMIQIPAGSFEMGSVTEGDFPLEDESPLHKVTINYDFYMGETEVTQAQWVAVMGGLPDELLETPFGEGDDYPIYDVSWTDICGPDGFLERLNARTQGHFRLPSESEWEYACRAGTDTTFWYGDTAECELDLSNCLAENAHGFRSSHMWFGWSNGSNRFPKGTKPVAQLSPNPFGLYDMHGNVWEWCQDWYDDTYAGKPTDGRANEQPGILRMRVFRGGHWGDIAWYCRSSSRSYCDPEDRSAIRGFRLVWTKE